MDSKEWNGEIESRRFLGRKSLDFTRPDRAGNPNLDADLYHAAIYSGCNSNSLIHFERGMIEKQYLKDSMLEKDAEDIETMNTKIG